MKLPEVGLVILREIVAIQVLEKQMEEKEVMQHMNIRAVIMVRVVTVGV